MQRPQRALDAVLVHASGGIDALAQTAHDLLVEQHGRSAAQTFVNDKANGVRADIHNGNRADAGQTPLRFRFDHAIPVYLCQLLFQPAISFGALDFRASPRPERLGLVMK
ncbi:hypothetical protein D3C87_1880810 [compost metagenome]